jgi:xylulokinase
MAYLMGIDVSTTGCKALIVDEKGGVVAGAVHEYRLLTPYPGWAEQHPEHWWSAAVASVRAALSKAGLSGKDMTAVGLTGQMHGSVFLDEKDDIIRPCILWCDQRTEEQCRWITATVGEGVLTQETLNPVLTGFTAPKIIWLRQREPENYARLRKVLLPKDYLRLRLTGEYATEVSDASGTSLLNVPKRQWSEPVLERLEIPEEMLPRCYESAEISGKVSKGAAEETGLAEGTPVAGGGGDQAAGAVGNGIVRTGLVSAVSGTSGVVFAQTDSALLAPRLLLHSFCHAVPGKWHLMGVMLAAGGSFRWFRDALGAEERAVGAESGKDPYEVLCEEAAQAAPGCEGLLFLPYLIGERTPYPDPDARGVFFGLSLRHTKKHLVRAVLEGVSYGLKDSFDIMAEMGVPIQEVRASGGGARSPLWRQIQADVTGYAHSTINVDEGPAFGAALLGGVGAGVYANVMEACDAGIRTTSITHPQPANHELYREFHGVYKSLYQALKDLFGVNARLVEKYLAKA